ncbi:MAG: hypothetical protein WAU59_11680, partial [Rhodoplanes sp.]
HTFRAHPEFRIADLDARQQLYRSLAEQILEPGTAGAGVAAITEEEAGDEGRAPLAYLMLTRQPMPWNALAVSY